MICGHGDGERRREWDEDLVLGRHLVGSLESQKWCNLRGIYVFKLSGIVVFYLFSLLRDWQVLWCRGDNCSRKMGSMRRI